VYTDRVRYGDRVVVFLIWLDLFVKLDVQLVGHTVANTV